MKVFKRISLILAVFVCVFLMTACGEKNVEGTLEELMTKMYRDIPETELPMGLENMEVNDENIESFLGAKVEYDSILAKESMIGAIAHSVVLVRTKDNADVEEIKNTIKENVNPRKWVCVGVEKEEVIIENRGNLIVVIIVQDENAREKLKTAFNNL